jgi:predicted MPP superfamily phosphohydrolase
MIQDVKRISDACTCGNLATGGRVPNNRMHYLKGVTLGTLGFCTGWAVDAQGNGPEWIEVVEIDLHLHRPSCLRKKAGGYDRLHGTRVAHISDLHFSRTVSSAYLHRCVERINTLDVDIVVLTGDYITYDFHGRYREKVIALLGNIESRFGAYACLGNHDYGVALSGRRRGSLLRRLIRGMEASGVTVLRNESTVLEIDGHPLWFVGLGDLNVGDFDPEKAFAEVPTDQVTIALMHNPRGVEHLSEFAANAVVSGHTHGRKARFSVCLPGTNEERRFHTGLYEFEGKKLYVNRGLGRVGRTRMNIRPEITVYTLR